MPETKKTTTKKVAEKPTVKPAKKPKEKVEPKEVVKKEEQLTMPMPKHDPVKEPAKISALEKFIFVYDIYNLILLAPIFFKADEISFNVLTLKLYLTVACYFVAKWGYNKLRYAVAKRRGY